MTIFFSEEEENHLDQLDNSSNFYKYFNRNVRHAFRRSSSTNSPNNNNHFKTSNSKQHATPGLNLKKKEVESTVEEEKETKQT